ncbi:Exosomal 3'-5' exoribonuclease complex subunit [Plasmodium coatneyi]|uniref:Exosomal 3'-5' exoribonuclease complex subunit n=1 Tax=Plasmodium coatneyi TaxID=208452 RepID=A0A1B1E4U7_9APIC|nr:Exosomal 3'-5' exoribonuclease complex subunit [Plasmodium coatneyi]ANQ09960.1 Exosomal 3'-5' exoribonuclease complex subunit [Plasmodium coatneyi]
MEDGVIISGDYIQMGKDKVKGINEHNFEQVHDVESENFYRSKCSGILLKAPYYPYKYDIMNTSYKYMPKVGDLVIGIVKSKKLDYYQMDINCNCECIIHKIESFKYATKSSFPNLTNGTLLYMIVEKINLDNNSVVASCINSSDVKSWINYENYLGELVDGYMFPVSISYAKSLIGDKCYILDLIGTDISYEVAVGHNGRVWIKTDDPRETNMIHTALKYSYGKTKAQMDVLWKSIYNLGKRDT